MLHSLLRLHRPLVSSNAKTNTLQAFAGNLLFKRSFETVVMPNLQGKYIHEEVIDSLKEQGVVTDEYIYNAFRAIDPQLLVHPPPPLKPDQIGKKPKKEKKPKKLIPDLPPKWKHYEISAWKWAYLSKCMEMFMPILRENPDKVMDVRGGDSYAAAVMCHITRAINKEQERDNKEYSVVMLDHNCRRLVQSRALFIDKFPDLVPQFFYAHLMNFEVEEFPEKIKGPYSLMHVSGYAKEVPKFMMDGLACPGLMTFPILEDDGKQTVYKFEKNPEGIVTKTPLWEAEVEYEELHAKPDA